MNRIAYLWGFTTVVIEVAVTQPYVSLLENARLWLESPRSTVNLALLAKYVPGSTTVTLIMVWEKEHPDWVRRSPRFQAPVTCGCGC